MHVAVVLLSTGTGWQLGERHSAHVIFPLTLFCTLTLIGLNESCGGEGSAAE